MVPQDIVIRRNHITRPLSWREPIVAAPAGLVATRAPVPPGAPAEAGGGKNLPLPPGTYSYRVVAHRGVAGGQRAFSLASDAVEVEIRADAGAVTLEWPAVTDAAGYRVYRRDGSARELWWPVKEPRFTDDGGPGEAGAPPKNATRWSVKNLLELKNARNVEIDGNTLEFNWQAAQDGYALLFKPVNQGGRAMWATIENVRVTNNVVRHVAAAININGTDTDRPSTRARGITIQNNLFIDVSRARWGGTGDFVKIGNGPADIVIEGNTVINDGHIINVYGGKGGDRSEGFVFRRNVVRHNRYGVKGQSTGIGLATLERFFPGGAFEENVIAGGKRAAYPPNNHVVADAEMEGLFADPAAGDYRVRSSYPGAGANIATLEAATGGRTALAHRE
jgi:hypothetical protein